MLSDIKLMEYHLNVLFKHDSNNRMTLVNEPPYDAAPKIFIGVTKLSNLVRFSNFLDNSMIEKLDLILEGNIGTNLVEVIKMFCNEHQFHHFWIGPAYVFPNINEKVRQNVIQVNYENKEMIKRYFPYTYEELDTKHPCFVKVVDNMPVSICCSARNTSKAAEASVFTFEDYRGRGYSTDVTLAWAAEVQKQGRIPLYSTSWDNFASQSLARKLNLIQFGTDIHIS
jgi:RimJ/RimL family protein N-acetyltransferase